MKRYIPWAIAVVAVLSIPVMPATYTYVVKELAQTFSAVQTFSAGLTVTGGTVTIPGVSADTKIVHICPSGCEYTTLNAACAGETSTSANPIIYYIHAGVYSAGSAQSCAGEDYATIQGDGLATRVISTQSGSGDYGAIDTGNSTNITIQNFYAKGHRAIWSDGTGGDIVIRNMFLETLADAPSTPDEDCWYGTNQPSGTEVRLFDNFCETASDGFTLAAGNSGTGVGPTNLKMYSANNIIRRIGTYPQAGYAFNFSYMPAFFKDVGSVIEWSTTGASGATGTVAMWFEGVASGCTTGCRAEMVGTNIVADNGDGNGEGVTPRGILITSTATELSRLDLYDVSIAVSTTDSTTGAVVGIRIENATTQVNTYGGRIRTSGGNTNIDLDGNTGTQIHAADTDYQTETNTEVDAINMFRVRSSLALFGAQTASASSQTASISESSSGLGLLIENTDAVNAEGSPAIQWNNSVAAGNHQWSAQVRDNDRFYIRDVTNGVDMIEVRPNSSFVVFGGPVHTNGSAYSIGTGATTDAYNVLFDAANDLQATWLSSVKALNLSGAEQLEIDCVTTMPTCDTAGRIVCDGDGTVGLCFCNGSAYVAFGGAADCT